MRGAYCRLISSCSTLAAMLGAFAAASVVSIASVLAFFRVARALI